MSLVSILVPCYNHEKYLDDCLNSLCEQTYQNIEIIVIDDCSSDNSYKILKEWEKRLSERFCNVYIERNERNQGICRNLNKMLKVAKGEYIKLLASDDMLFPNAIENFINYAKNCTDDIIFSNIVIIPENAKYPVISAENFPKRYLKQPSVGRGLTGELCGDNFIAAPGVFIPRRTFEKFGVFDEKYSLEDFEYWLRVSITGSFGYLDEITALYRQSAASLSRFSITEEGKKRHRNFHQEKMRIFKRYQDYAKQEQITIFYNNELGSAIGHNDKELTNKLIKEMKDLKINIYIKYRIKAILVNSGIYILLKNVKRKINNG